MVSRTESGEITVEKDNQLSATAAEQKRKSRFDRSYGAMTMIMGYLPLIEQLKL